MSSTSALAATKWHRLTLTSVFSKSIADRLLLASLVGWGLFAMGVWLGPLYNSMAGGLEQLAAGLPESMTAIFGDMTTPSGWLNIEMYSLFAPALLAYVAVASAVKGFANEEEDLSIGLLAANPISRTSLALQKAGATVVHVVLATALTGVGVWVGVVIAGLPISAGRVAAITVHLGLLGLLVGALAMLFAVATGRRLVSMIAAASITMIAYVWGTFTPLSESLERFAVLSPWHWYHGPDPLVNGMDWGYAGLSFVLAALLLSLALWVFNRRDLPG
jgi:ABC-2 type transport system permease protein